MYIHLGQNKIISDREIIGIFDLDNTTVSKITRDSLSISEREGRVETLGYELPKSFILREKKGEGSGIIISPVSSATLIKRAERK